MIRHRRAGRGRAANVRAGEAHAAAILDSALDAVNEEVANREEWVIELWSHGRPLRWVAEGLGHTRADDDYVRLRFHSWIIVDMPRGSRQRV